MLSDRPMQLALIAVAAALPAAFTLNPVIDNDTWWHLRVGQRICETGSVPEFDAFSRLGREKPTPWLAYSWLFEAALYQVYAAGGLTGVILARTALCAFSSAVVIGFVVRRVGLSLAGIASLFLTAVVLMVFGKERPWHVTIAFTTLTLAAVTQLREGECVRRCWWLPLLFALWANLHIQFVLGWLVLGLACLFPGSASRRHLIALTAACVLATFVNPYHVRLLGVIWDYATQSAPLRMVQELAPPDVDSVWTWATFALLGWAAVRTLMRRPLDGFQLVLLLAGVALSLRMRRDIWFGTVAAIAVLGETSPAAIRVPRWLVCLMVAGTYAAVRTLNFAGFGPSHDFATAIAQAYPQQAVAVVRERQLPVPLFNSFDWGGYLIWALPEHPVTIDGRTNLYGSERVARSMNTWVAGADWEADPDLRSANLIIARKGNALAETLLTRGEEWLLAYEDATAVVFVRTAR